MRATAPVVPVLAVALLSTSACQMNERITGTIIGAAGGAVVGGLLGSAVGSTAAGVVLGAAAGGAAGYIWGDYVADKRERECCATTTYGPAPAAYSRTAYAPAPPPDVATMPAVAAAKGSIGQDRSRARALYEEGRRATSPAVALAKYEEAIRLDPSRPEPHNAKGLVFLFQGKRSDARSAFERALAADASYEPARFNLRKLAGA